MRIDEYDLLLEAFHRSFGFMLNRLADAGLIEKDPHADLLTKERAEDQCFNEFMVALEEMGVALEQAKVEPL